MKFSLLTAAVLLVTAALAFVITAPVGATVDLATADIESTYVSDLLGTTPIWMQVDTAFICPPDHGPYTCRNDGECQLYYGLPSNYVCVVVDPGGGRCNGACQPC